MTNNDFDEIVFLLNCLIVPISLGVYRKIKNCPCSILTFLMNETR